jgi:hypothetical protein
LGGPLLLGDVPDCCGAAVQVTFHAMARHVAALWPLSFDISRSQSCLRIATTAAPVSAADLEREWLESAADPEEGTIHVRTLRKRPRSAAPHRRCLGHTPGAPTPRLIGSPLWMLRKSFCWGCVK